MKKVLLVAFLLSLLYPAFYLIFQLTAPKGFVFSGMVGGDDGTNLAVMTSVSHNLENPWALSEPKNVFLNPNMGSPFLFVPLGYLAKFLGNQFLLVFQISRFLGAVFFLLAVYIFLKEFFGEKKAWRIFLLFCFSFGLGGLLFLRMRSLVPDLPYVGMWRPITYELFEGAGLIPLTILGRHYYTIPLALGFLSVVFLKRAKVVLGGMLLALTFLFYPALGIAFYIISALYLLIENGLKQRWSLVFPYYFVSLSGIIPWVTIYLIDSTSFKVYASLVKTVNPQGLFVSLIPNLLFVPLTLLQVRKTNLFFSLWFLLILVLAVLRTPLAARFMLVLWLPLTVLSYMGIENLVALLRKKVSVGFVVALLIVLTFPSMLFFSTRFLRKPLEPYKWDLFPDYLPQNEYRAHQFLKSLPNGVVLSSDTIGTNLPFLANKISVLGRESIMRGYWEYRHKLDDLQRFFDAGASANDRWERVKKYNIDYIYFGQKELDVSRGGINIEDLNIFTKVFEEDDVVVYQTK